MSSALEKILAAQPSITDWQDELYIHLHKNPELSFVEHKTHDRIVEELEKLDGIEVESEPFYFCHSFAIDEVKAATSSSSFRYDRDYVAIFEHGNIAGVQFHPEKSQEPGARLLANFLQLKR